ncbi:hypothetical protein ACSBR1_041430 [Camellia fascicularis]
MAVYYKFKSAKDYDSIPTDGHFISLINLKEKIFESKHLGKGTDFDLVVTNAQTNEEYLDEAMLIPKNTSVLIRRVPGQPRMRIITQPVIGQDEPKLDTNKFDDAQQAKSSFLGADSSAMKYSEDSEWDEFGNDLYAIPEVLLVQASNSIQDAPHSSKADEDSKIKAFIDTPALDWQRHTSDGFGHGHGHGRGFGRGGGGRIMGARGFGQGGLERKTPPQGYICHRCKVAGHFIQHCPTNGDSNFDIRRVKPPTGIPKSMLMATPDGSYALPSGAVAVLKPNETAFEKEMDGLPSTRSVGDLPPEFHCSLCKQVMKDAVLTSKCCFKSFCDKCIRDYIMSKSVCVCGATNILADDLLPNKTLRDTINRILESNNSSAENSVSAFQVQDMESKIPQAKMESKIRSPTLSATSKGELVPPPQSSASKGEQGPPPQSEEISKVKETGYQLSAINAPQNTLEKGRIGKAAYASEAMHDSMSVKPASQGSALLADEEMQQKPVSGEAVKKNKKKKTRLPLNAAEMQWKTSQDLAAENYMMPQGPSTYNPYWTGMQPGMEGYVAQYGGSMPYVGYGFGPLDVPFGVLPHAPFGGHGYMMPPVPPRRDVANFGMGFNPGPPMMMREESVARNANLRWKHEIERRGERELSKDREFRMEVSSSGDISSSLKSNHMYPPQPPSADHRRHRSGPSAAAERNDRRDPELPRLSSKRKPDYDYDYDPRDHDDRRSHHRRSALEPPPHKSTAAAEQQHSSKQKSSVFSRMSFPDEEAAGSKRRKLSSSSESNKKSPMSMKSVSVSRKDGGGVDCGESSDEDRHFKRRSSRYESPATATEWEEEGRRSRDDRDRGGGGGGYSHNR